jgi:hypothetical protein
MLRTKFEIATWDAANLVAEAQEWLPPMASSSDANGLQR